MAALGTWVPPVRDGATVAVGRTAAVARCAWLGVLGLLSATEMAAVVTVVGWFEAWDLSAPEEP